MLSRRTSLVTGLKQRNKKALPLKSEDFRVDVSGIVGAFTNEYGKEIKIYAGVDKVANKRLSTAKVKYMKMEIPNGL